MSQAATLEVVAKAAAASAHIDQAGVKEALGRLLEHQRMMSQQMQLDKLLAQFAEVQETAFKLPPGYQEQLKQMLSQSGLGERLTEQIQASVVQNVTPSLSFIAETAAALTFIEKEELEKVVSVVGDELRSTTEPVDDSSEAALPPISGPLAAWLAAMAVSAVLAMLLRWTDFQISQADQATLDMALDLLAGVPAWRADSVNKVSQLSGGLPPLVASRPSRPLVQQFTERVVRVPTLRRRGWRRILRSRGQPRWSLARPYSHSMVPGGLDVMSKTTRLTWRISLIMREATRSRRS